jgi:RHS repeat-associated protein
VVAHCSYDPHPNAVSIDESGLSQPNIIRYTRGAFDQATGLTKLGQRHYNPAFGAFTQQDTNQLLANPQNGNLYAYASDSPVSYIDPTGQSIWGACWCPVLTFGGAVLAVAGVVVSAPVIAVGGAIVAIAGLFQMECKYGGSGSIWTVPGRCGVFG